MGGITRWPQLGDLRRVVLTKPGVQMWLFGSALTSHRPADLDVLLVYCDLDDIEAIRSAHAWAEEIPPINIIAMTAQEESDYAFVRGVHAHRML